MCIYIYIYICVGALLSGEDETMTAAERARALERTRGESAGLQDGKLHLQIIRALARLEKSTSTLSGPARRPRSSGRCKVGGGAPPRLRDI